ncbi:DUF4266 domain-containing protein [Algiphilus sp.]|uniref:DUF4266 domain-containing protein n=1 Tax=Algiphilus sp. TaxID=1872431 RepID=UPI0025C3BB3C|nr:DUF4266 domain-containing protein [Algiphilus sp.]MCK5769814.1 DUF4266 domain-containing protein [Algiphilus sp.]
MKTVIRLVAGLATVGALSGCALTMEEVQPWQMDNLARSEMALQIDPQMAAYRSHIAFSKEAATGGASVSGGGCGCN